jgi:hypothetical protein
MSEYAWSGLGLENLMDSEVQTCRSTRVFDGEGSTQTLSALTTIRGAVTLYQGKTVLVYDANEDIRVGDLVLAPVIT